MIMLNRFLLSEGMIKKCNVVCQVVGKKDVSDPIPIWIQDNKLNLAPKPFKKFSCWFEHHDFVSFINEVWKSGQVQEKCAYVMKERLNFLKEKLRKWNVEVFGKVNLEVDVTVKDLNGLDDFVTQNV